MSDQLAMELQYLAAAFHDFDGANDANALDSAHLERRDHRVVLDAIRTRRARGERVTVSAVLDDVGKAELRGVIQSASTCDLPDDVAVLTGQLRRAGIAREAKRVLVTCVGRLDQHDFDGARTSASDLSSVLSETSERIDPIYDFPQLVERTTCALVDAHSADGRLIALGTPTIDRHYLASPGMLTVVGASTNVGKSSLLLAWALSIAQRSIPVGIVSVEDPAEDFGAKAVGALSRARISDAWQRRLPTDELERALTYAGGLKLPLYFAEIKSRRLDSVLTRMEQLVRGHGVRIVLVDYLQAIAHRDGKDLRERIDRTLEELIACAGRLDVPLVLASQLSRIGRNENRREPTLSDLKESGSIENRAQCVVMLWREDDSPGAPVLGKLAKLKRGSAGVRFTLHRDTQTGELREIEGRS